ncbi:hypothetical protein [Streptomyces sp. NPDC089915]|uniref:hypothetical protein n=1 Tax=Streptomyces sp. NPDC089915 TaxID=3155186 RepID=UPI003422DD57
MTADSGLPWQPQGRPAGPVGTGASGPAAVEPDAVESPGGPAAAEKSVRAGGADPAAGSVPADSGLAWYERAARGGWEAGDGSEAGLPPLPAGGWGPPAVPPPPPPLPPPPPGRGQWRTPLLAGVVAAVVGGGAVAAWVLLGAGGGPAADARPPARTATATAPATPRPSAPATTGSPSGGPAPSGSPSPSAGPGHTVVHDEAGFSVAVPDGWGASHDEQGNGAFYRPPGGDRSALIQIFRITEPASTGSCELLRMSSERLSGGTPAYRQVSIDPVAGSSCELVYEYDSAESHGRRRGMERIVTTPDGNRWALLAAGPAADATTTRANLTAALESFRPE